MRLRQHKKADGGCGKFISIGRWKRHMHRCKRERKFAWQKKDKRRGPWRNPLWQKHHPDIRPAPEQTLREAIFNKLQQREQEIFCYACAMKVPPECIRCPSCGKDLEVNT